LAQADSNNCDLVMEHPQNSGGIGVGSVSEQKTCNVSEMVKTGPRLLWRTNGKSHTRFRVVRK